MKKYIFLVLIVFVLTSCEKEKNYLREGNKDFEEKHYAEAEDNYRKSLNVDSNYVKAQYNLANSTYKQNKEDLFNQSLLYYDKVLSKDSISDTAIRANTFYNRGNTNFKIAIFDSIEKGDRFNDGLKKAVEDYKQTLKINPQDSSAKYNLSLAMRLLKQNQQQNKQKQKKDDQKQEQKPKNQEQNKPKQNQDNQRMLEALKNNERNTLEKLKKEKDKKIINNRNNKDW
jgi:tetratricopeptide (TPR) repeat protein